MLDNVALLELVHVTHHGGPGADLQSKICWESPYSITHPFGPELPLFGLSWTTTIGEETGLCPPMSSRGRIQAVGWTLAGSAGWISPSGLLAATGAILVGLQRLGSLRGRQQAKQLPLWGPLQSRSGGNQQALRNTIGSR